MENFTTIHSITITEALDEDGIRTLILSGKNQPKLHEIVGLLENAKMKLLHDTIIKQINE